MLPHSVRLWWSCSFVLFCTSLWEVSGSNVKRTYKLGVLVPFNKGRAHVDGSSAERYAQAIPVAMEKIKTMNYNFNLTWVWNDTMCNDSLAIQQQIWQLHDGVDAFVGPARNCKHTLRTAVAFNKPVMSFKCDDTFLADRKIYKTVARTSLTNFYVVRPLLATLKHFNWKKVAIVYQDLDKWVMIREYVSKIFNSPKNNITILFEDTVAVEAHNFFLSKFHNLRASVKRIKKQARIVILLMEQEITMEYMLQAYEEGLVQTGEYVFIGFDLNPHLLVHKSPMKWYFSHYHGDKNMIKIMNSFAALLLLQVKPITGPSGEIEPKYLDFTAKVREKSHELPFKTNAYKGCLWPNDSGKKCNETSCRCLFKKSNTKVPLEAAHLYHAIMEYAYALNETLANNLEPNGGNIINALKGHAFDSVFGFQMGFDDQADVVFNVTLLHQEYVNGTKEKTNCEPFRPEKPCRVMRSIGEFWWNAKDIHEQVYHAVKKKLTWYNGRTGVPQDTPKCGFSNKLCPNTKESDVSGSNVKRTYKLGVLVPFNKGRANVDGSSAEKYAQAIPVAMEKIKTMNYNFNLTWVWNDTMCNDSLAIQQQIWQLHNGVDAFVGPARNCKHTLRTAVAFDKPVMSFKCDDTFLADRKIYKTVARTSLTNFYVVRPLLATLKHFNWKKVAIVYQDLDKWVMIREYVSKIFNSPKNNITILFEDTVAVEAHNFFLSKFHNLRASVKRIKKQARIVILLMEQEITMEYMLQAYEEGLVQTGEYVFIGFDLNPHLLVHKIPMKWYFSHYHGDKNMVKIMNSFAALLLLQVRPITGPSGEIEPKYLDFTAKVREKSHELPFKTDAYTSCLWKNGSSKDCNETSCRCVFKKSNTNIAELVPLEAAHLYHAIMEYAYALNETLANNLEPNGGNIINALKGHAFDSVFGFQMGFDDQADVVFNVTLLHQEYVNGTKEKTNCEPFRPEKPCRVMRSIGEFWWNAKDIDEQVYHAVKKKLTWYNGRTGVPQDTSKCGFSNELCPNTKESDDNSTVILGSVCGILGLLVVVLVLYIIYRNTNILDKLVSIRRTSRKRHKNEDYDQFCSTPASQMSLDV